MSALTLDPPSATRPACALCGIPVELFEQAAGPPNGLVHRPCHEHREAQRERVRHRDVVAVVRLPPYGYPLRFGPNPLYETEDPMSSTEAADGVY